MSRYPRSNMEALGDMMSSRRYDTEWEAWIHAIMWAGIPYSHWHMLPQEEMWQKLIAEGGYNVTAFACHLVQIGDEQFVFSTGKAVWTVNPDDPDDQQGHGPNSPLLFVRNAKTGEVRYRTFNPDGPDRRYEADSRTLTGVKALARQYGFEAVLSSPGYLNLKWKCLDGS